MKRILFLLFLLFSLSCVAQNYLIKNLGITQGLSNNHVVSIEQDKRGFIWLATEEGLNMFDGIKFRSYYKDKGSIVLTGNELNGLLDDPIDSILWIATQRAGINAYNYKRNTLSTYKNNPKDVNSLITNDITKIVASADGNLWISTYWKGIDYYNKKSGIFTHYNTQTIPGLPNDNIWTVLDGNDGFLYIGHVNHGFSILNLKNHKVVNFTHDPNDPESLPNDEVTCIYKDLLNNIWVGTSGGLALYNPEKHNFRVINDKNNSLSHRIFSIIQTKDNKLWIAMELGGIAIIDLSQHLFYNPNQVVFTVLNEQNGGYGLSGNSIRSLFQDSFGNIWVGGWGNGIDFISQTSSLFYTYSFSPFGDYNCLTNKTASSLCFDTNGRLWIGTDGGGINLFQDGKRIKVFKTANFSSNENTIQASFCDSRGGLWFGLFLGGIRYLSPGKEVFEHISLKPVNTYTTDIRCFFEDKEGRIWIGTSEGIFVLDRDTKAVLNHYNLENNLVRTIYITEKGEVWVGYYGNGLCIYNKEMRRIREYYGTGFPSNTVNMITVDRQKRIWVGTGEGLVVFKNDTDKEYRAIKNENGLINSHIYAIAQDRKDNIWISSNRGLSCLLAKDNTIRNYDHHENVPLGSFCRGSVAQDMEGNLFFGSINGVCFFNPDHVLMEQASPQVFINTLEIADPISNGNALSDEICITDDKEIRLTDEQNSFTITFNIQNYALNSLVEYAYKLEGLSDSWYTVKQMNSVTFRNLPHGHYTFFIKSRIRNQKWSDNISKLSIYIAPPIWFTWWAKTCYCLFVVGVIIFITRSYKRQLEVESLYNLEKKLREQEHELNTERLHFYTNITHELRTPLTLILGPLEDLTHNPSFSVKDSQTIHVIYKSAIRLLNLINQLLEFRKVETQNRVLCVEHGNIIPFIEEIVNKYKSLNNKQEVRILFDHDEEEIIQYYDHEIIQIVLDNLISNALKYTDKGCITIGICTHDTGKTKKTQIWVSDTGCGIDEDAISHIFERYYQANNSKHVSGTGIGLSLVKKLIDLHEGEISIESKIGKGSTFRIYLLKDNFYPDALHAEKKDDELALIPTKNEKETNKEEKPIMLIVEDNNDIAQYIAESFNDKYEVYISNNGKDGIDMAFKFIPDIIVSDIMMPVMDGNSMCRILKTDIRTSHIPIILLTAKDSIQDKEEGYMMGADSYITKPFSSSLLRSRINNIIDSRTRLAEYYHKNDRNCEVEGSSEVSAVNVLDDEFLQKLNNLIEDYMSSDKIDIAFISGKMFMSSSTLYRKMKALTGLSTNEYIRKRKMRHAEHLLLEGRYNISEIALLVGFNNLFYFRQCFKDEYGMTPSDYVKMKRNTI